MARPERLSEGEATPPTLRSRRGPLQLGSQCKGGRRRKVEAPTKSSELCDDQPTGQVAPDVNKRLTNRSVVVPPVPWVKRVLVVATTGFSPREGVGALTRRRLVLRTRVDPIWEDPPFSGVSTSRVGVLYEDVHLQFQ